MSHVDAALAALNARLGELSTPRAAYDLDNLPPELPDAYVEVTVSRRFIEGSPRSDGEKTSKGWRLFTRAVARTSGNAERLHELCSEVLEFNELAVDGQRTTPLEFETADPVQPDEGWFSGAWTWTYLLTTNPA